MSTPDEALARAMHREDPEEPCDADGRDEHRWCDNCIARAVIARSGLAVVSARELPLLRVLARAVLEGVSR